MRSAFCIVAIMLLTTASDALAKAYKVGQVDQPPCERVVYEEKKSFTGAKTKIPVTKQAPQKTVVFAVLDHPGAAASETEVIKDCLRQTTKKIGLLLMVSDTAGASILFKDRVIECLNAKTPPITVKTAFLRTETKCPLDAR